MYGHMRNIKAKDSHKIPITILSKQKERKGEKNYRLISGDKKVKFID